LPYQPNKFQKLTDQPYLSIDCLTARQIFAQKISVYL